MYILVTGYSKMQNCVILRKKSALHHGNHNRSLHYQSLKYFILSLQSKNAASFS